MANQYLTILFCAVPEAIAEPVSEVVQKHAGKLLKTIGEARIFAFSQPMQGLEAASAMQKRFSAPPSPQASPSGWRAGLAVGDVAVTANDVFGEAVNLAARLEGVAGLGEVYVSEPLRHAAHDASYHFTDMGRRTFKGMPAPVRVFALGKVAAPPPKEPPPKVVQTSEELFDFSRVEQERIQESNDLALDTETKPDPYAAIPLAHDEKIETPATKPKAVPPPLIKMSKSKRQFQRKAMLYFVVGVIGIPALLMGGGWGYGWFITRPKPPAEDAVSKKLEQSEVMKAMRTKRPKSRKRGASIAYGSLFIKTRPRTVDIYINNRVVAHQSPVRIKKVPADQPIRLKVSKAGYKEDLQLLSLSADQEKILTIKLQKKK